MRLDPCRLARPLLASLIATIFLPGCQGNSRRLFGGSSTAANEPGLNAEIQPGVTVVEPGSGTSTGSASSGRMVAALDRHPLLRKPKEYYDNTNSNKAVKVAAATVVGVPAGIVGEIKQIVVGTPGGATSTTPSSTVY